MIHFNYQLHIFDLQTGTDKETLTPVPVCYDPEQFVDALKHVDTEDLVPIPNSSGLNRLDNAERNIENAEILAKAVINDYIGASGKLRFPKVASVYFKGVYPLTEYELFLNTFNGIE